MTDSNANAADLTVSREAPAASASGYLMLLVLLAALALGVWGIADTVAKGAIGPLAIVAGTLLFVFVLCGFYMLQPNQAAAITLFGSYRGTDRTSGLRWVLPWLIRKKISVRATNFISERIKVNELRGNPIEIAAQIVWRVTDTAQALFDVDDYKAFVEVQTEAAVRSIGSRYAYDDLEHQEEVTLRGSHEEVNRELRLELIARLQVAGITIDECGLTHLAYAPEIASAMLRRQQAEAVIAARAKLVMGAVSMVEMALNKLSNDGIIDLDHERKATMVSNLMVVLCGEREVNPVLNAGSLYQ